MSRIIVLLLLVSFLNAAVAKEAKTYPVYGKLNKHILDSNNTITDVVFDISSQVIFSDALVTLDGNLMSYQAFVKNDGTFYFTNVLPGAYLMNVHSSFLTFPGIRTDVSKRYNGKIKARNVIDRTPVRYPFELHPINRVEYFATKQSLNILQLLMGNSMIWMVLVLIGGTYLVKSMSNMEDFKELQKENKENTFDPMTLLPNLSEKIE
eukprot:TRINITY_DN10283_c0_g1_i1.p1 TRINITY_DN10283_c0_g1~~TRINITY_DN10283_c0_g1_i1.p1  ORF type:complete len:227 (-),score=44.19 TRINITY_DN10283_c0_g1_i1:47-670(-)